MNIISLPGSKLQDVPPGNVAGPRDLAPPETTWAAGQVEVVAAARRLPVGAELTPQGVNFRVWAPERGQVAVVLAEGLEGLAPFPLEPEANGYFSRTIESARAGALYWYRLDGEARLLSDPVSRFQPDGPMGASEVIDPDVFAWTDAEWPGVGWNDQVLYEMHVGTFAREGTWRAAIEQLPMLADLGITIIEMMPVADFTGRYGWGYDGVNLFAPTRLYGGPDDLRAFIDAAHSVGLGVTSSTITWVRPETSCPSSRRAISRRGTRLTGGTRSTLTDRVANRYVSISRQRSLLDSRVSFRRTAAGCHAEHLR